MNSRANHDPLLAELVRSAGGPGWDDALEHVLRLARPVADRVLRSFRLDGVVAAADVDDVISSVMLRLFRKLRAVANGEDEFIESFEDYVATLTYRGAYDYLRRRYPERTRLKNRLRYLLTRDPRFALWKTDGGLVAGLSAWQGRPALDQRLTRDEATQPMLDRAQPAHALLALFERLGAPLLFESLVRTAADLWRIADTVPHPLSDAMAASHADPLAEFETRETLGLLWSEIALLPERQRAALLLNLRDADGNNAASLFILTGIITMDQMAAALDMTTAALIALWNDLPLDDLTIAGRFGLTRQQVISLRKSARQRLGRRMAKATQ